MIKLKYHTDCSSLYDKNGGLFPNPTQTLEELEMKHQEIITKYYKIDSIHLLNNNEYDMFDIELLRFNLCNIIENLEWKIEFHKLTWQREETEEVT